MRQVSIHVNDRYVSAFENYINDEQFEKHLKKGIFIMSNLFDEGDARNEVGKAVDIQHEDGTNEFNLLYRQNEMYDNFGIECVTPVLDVDCISGGVVFDNDYFPTEENFTINRIVKFFPTFLRSHK
jgi:hypothetical protein